MKYYFSLQARLFFRSLKNYNENPYAIAIVSFLIFIFISIVFLNKVPYAPYLYLLFEIGIVLSLGSRYRNQFLSSIFLKKKYIQLRILENLLVALPFIVFLLYKNQFLLVIVNVALCLALSFCNNISSNSNFTVPSPFSKRPYEFTTGFRKTYLFLVVIYGTAIYSVIQHNHILSMCCLLAVYVVCMAFYSHLDPVFYVWIHAHSSKIFLWEKIKTAMLYSSLLSLPVVLLFILFYPANVAVTGIILIVGMAYLLTTILYVYVNFPVKTTQSQNLQYIAGLLFPPLLILIIPNFYFQAVRRLKDYLLC